MSGLTERLRSWGSARVVVVGDVMLDELVYGDAERMTADAPVPVLAVKRTERIPGGAANVCLNLAALGAQVSVVAVVGDDEEGRVLRSALEEAGVDTGGLIIDASRPTTVKRGLVGLAQHRHPQKMFRLDIEKTDAIEGGVRGAVLDAVRNRVGDADVVAIEDYDKGVLRGGVCEAVIAEADSAGVTTMVDPASIGDYARYTGCGVITPNRTEAEKATGLPSSAADELASALLDGVGCGAVVLTLDREGALLLERGSGAVRVPTVARDVYDVTGAGDMVLAALAAAVGNGLELRDAVRFANAAAGLEVEVFGVRPMPFERVYRAILHEEGALTGKGRTLDQALIEVRAARREGKRVVFTNGCFDILHAGHIHLLRTARSHGDLLVVGLNSDASVRRLKGVDRPVHVESDRVTVLSELESVGVVVVFEEDTPMRLIETLRPDVLVKGGDYTREGVVGGDLVESWGGRVELIDLVEGRSTSGVIERVRGSVATANDGGRGSVR